MYGLQTTDYIILHSVNTKFIQGKCVLLDFQTHIVRDSYCSYTHKNDTKFRTDCNILTSPFLPECIDGACDWCLFSSCSVPPGLGSTNWSHHWPWSCTEKCCRHSAHWPLCGELSSLLLVGSKVCGGGGGVGGGRTYICSKQKRHVISLSSPYPWKTTTTTTNNNNKNKQQEQQQQKQQEQQQPENYT